MIKRPSVKSNGGYTLIEIMIAMVSLMAVVLGVLHLSVEATRMTTRVQSQFALPKVIRSVTQQIYKDEVHFPAIFPDSRFKNGSYDPWSDTNVTTQKCFNDQGFEMPMGDVECKFKVSYYRLAVLDGKFADTSDLAPIPMSKLYLKIQYKKDNQDTEFYMSRMLTSYLAQ